MLLMPAPGPRLFDQRGPSDQTQLYACKGLDGQSSKKSFVVPDEAPYFSEALGFSLPSLSVNLARSDPNDKPVGTQATGSVEIGRNKPHHTTVDGLLQDAS